MSKKIIAIMLLLALVFALFAGVTAAFAEEGGGGGDSGSDSDSGGGSPGWLSGFLDAIGKLTKAILEFPQKLAQEGGRLLIDIYLNLIGITIDDFLALFNGILAKSFLSTVYMSQISWVRTGNAIAWVTCLAVAILLMTIAIYRTLQGKRDIKNVLLTFFATIFLGVFSIQVVNFMIWMVNVTVATVGQNALNSLTGVAGGVNLEIGKLTGAQIMAFPFQHPDTLATAMPFHSNFIKPALGEITGSARYANGGILALLFAAAGWLLIMLLCAARLFVLCAGTIFAPVYISMSMLSSRIEPAIGWLMLMVRSVFVQLLWVFVWASMIWINVSYVKANLNDTLGFIAAGANSIMLFITAYLTYRFWLKPSVGQIMQPATLAGAMVIENVGKATAAVGKLVEAVGMITLQPEVVATGAGIKTGGDKLITTGEALKAKQAPEKLSPGGAIDALHSRAQKRYEKYQEEQKKKEQRRYWKYGEKFIIRDEETGLPVEVPAPPAGYEFAGNWPPA